VLPDNVPPCPHCESRSFNPGSSHLGGSLNQQGFTCKDCQTFVQLYGHQGGHLLVYIARDICTPLDADSEHPSWQFPEAFTNWVNKTMLPAWRHRVDQLEAIKAEGWKQWLAEVFYVDYPELKGSIPPDYAERGSPSPFTDTSISFPSCPDEAKALYDSMFGQGRSATALSFGPLPPHLDGPVYPPQCPDIKGLSLYFFVEGAWDKVDPAMSATLKAPEDPLLVHNREFFDDVFAQVAHGLGEDSLARVETKNGYGGNRPWYAIRLGNAVVVAGWRKRVVSITVELETGFSAVDMQALAKRDSVTYSAYGPLVVQTADDLDALLLKDGRVDDDLRADLVANYREKHPDGNLERDGGGNDPRETAMKLGIHAWGKDKTVEYLTTLCRAVLLAQEL
jgi:hypothetical protein